MALEGLLTLVQKIKSTLCIQNKDFQGDICLLAMSLCKQDSAISRIVSYARGWEDAGPSSKTFTQQKYFMKKSTKRSWYQFCQWETYTVCIAPKL